MKCPYFVDEETAGTTAQCLGLIIPFEPSLIDRTDYCTTSRHRCCPLYRNAGSDLSLAIHREVARAIGSPVPISSLCRSHPICFSGD